MSHNSFIEYFSTITTKNIHKSFFILFFLDIRLKKMLKIYQFNVRFGKQKLEIYFRKRNANMSCARFLEYVLYKIQAKNNNYDDLLPDEDPSDYGLFECISGIEQMINEHQNIFEINNFVEHQITEVTSEQIVVLSSTFIIRKKNQVEQAPSKILSTKAMSKIKSFYKKRVIKDSANISSSGFGSCPSLISRKPTPKRDLIFDIKIRQRKRKLIHKPKYLTFKIKIDNDIC